MVKYHKKGLGFLLKFIATFVAELRSLRVTCAAVWADVSYLIPDAFFSVYIELSGSNSENQLIQSYNYETEDHES